MTDQDDRTDIKMVGDPMTQLFRRRLIESRWVLTAAAVVFLVLVVVHAIPVGHALAGFTAIFAATLVMPRRPRAIRQAVRAEISRDLWPDTGMKIVVEALPQAGFLIDRRGIVRYVNGEAQHLFGQFRPGDPLSFRLRVPSFLEALDRVLTGGGPERIRWSEKVPTERWLEAYITPVTARGDGSKTPAKAPFILVVVSDLTEQHKLDRTRADFVANASHELRTPLASLSGFIETLQGPARDDAEARRKFLDIMSEQAARMSRLISDLLSLSRIEMRSHLRPDDEIDLRDIIQHCIDAMRPLAEEFEVTVKTDLPAEGLIVKGDHDELVQVFENLIENAIKYGCDGKRVLVSASRQSSSRGAGTIVIGIRDWGPGIAAEHLPRLTERFYRIDVASSRELKGTGLGLAIVKHILNRHRAEMTIGNAPDKGAIFTVRIPAFVVENESRISKINQ